MTTLAKETNTHLKALRDVIRTCEPGAYRNHLQSCFDETIERLKQMPDRILMQIDAGYVGTTSRAVDDACRTELLWALRPLDKHRDVAA